jgi:hypothetical protein
MAADSGKVLKAVAMVVTGLACKTKCRAVYQPPATYLESSGRTQTCGQGIYLWREGFICGEGIYLWRGDLSPLGCVATLIRLMQLV